LAICAFLPVIVISRWDDKISGTNYNTVAQRLRLLKKLIEIALPFEKRNEIR